MSIIVILLLIYSGLFSQDITITDPNCHKCQRLPLTNEQFFEQAEFIFEGRLIAKSWVSYDVLGDLSGKGFYTSSIIKVKHVYKGGDKIKKGTIEIIKKGGTIIAKDEMGWDQYYQYYDEGQVSIGTGNDAVFFCKESDFPRNPNPRKFTNKISVSHLANGEYAALTIGDIRYGTEDYKKRIRGLNYLNFANKAEFYQYIKQFKGINIPKEEKKIKNGEDGVIYIRGGNKILQDLKKKVRRAHNNKHKLINKRENGNNLTIKIDSQKVTGNDPYFFEFDVMACCSIPLITKSKIA